MPYRFQIEPDRCFVTVSPEGLTDLAESLAAIRELDNQVRTAGAVGALLDFRNNQYIASYRDVQLLAEETGRILGALPMALMVAGMVQTGVARQFAAQSECYGVRIEMFTEPSAAASWLRGLDPPD